MKIAATASLVSLFSLLSSVSAAPAPAPNGHAVVVNNCVKDIYLWSVGGSIGPRQVLSHGERYSEPIHVDPVSGGVAIKITRTPNGLFDGSPQMNYAYALDGDDVFYDLSDVFGDPFAGHPVSVVPRDAECPRICWADGVSPGGSQVHDCSSVKNIVLTTCATSC